MQLGFLTACLPKLTLEEIADWAVSAGYEALEVAAWPDLGERPFIATHLNVENTDARYLAEVKNIFDSRNLKLSSIAFMTTIFTPSKRAVMRLIIMSSSALMPPRF
jgi:sugar phosphate isomerase/epimerase